MCPSCGRRCAGTAASCATASGTCAGWPSSAERLGLPLDAAAARAVLAGRLAGAPPSRVRLRLARDGALAVDVGPLPPPQAGPVRLGLDDEPVDDGDLLLFHKTSRREPYDRRRRRRPDVDDVVLVNGRGELTEVTTANLAVRCDGRWWTPPVHSGLLPGVERGRLVEPAGWPSGCSRRPTWPRPTRSPS